MDEKDRLGQFFDKKERAEENRFFAERDRELIERLRQKKADEDEQLFRELIHLRCPRCGERLAQREIHEVAIDECPGCQGIWLDKGEFEALSKHRGNEWVEQFTQRLTHLLTHPTS